MPGRGRASKAPGAGFGTSSRASSVRWDRDSLSWRTCEPSLLEESTKFSGRWPTSGMMRSGALYGHPTWVPRRDASGFLLWPTATVAGNYNVKGLSPTSADGLATAARNWSTPRASPNENRTTKATPSQTAWRHGAYLVVEAMRWATPSSRDHKDTPGMATTGTNPNGSTRDRVDQLPRQAYAWAGTTPSPSEAQTEPFDSSRPKPRRKGLNPRFGLWLMGFPVAWLDCAPSGTRSSRKSRKSSGDGC